MAECSSNFSDNTSTFAEKRSKRKIRNETEKRRRDSFNRLIDELTLLVAKGDRKMDKSSVLKCAINFLKQQHFQAESTSDEASNVILMDSKLRTTTGYNLPDIVQLYMDALAAGTYCIQCSGHIEYASTSIATLFDNAICELKGKNFFDFLDDTSAEGFSKVLSTAVLHFAAASTTVHNSAIQETVVTKKSRRQLLITGYLKKITDNTDHLCMPDTAAKSGAGNNTTGFIKNVEANESFRFVGVIVPLSNRPESEITLETISLWEQRNSNFTILYNTEFVCVDAEGCQLLGYSRFDLLGTSGYDYIHMDDLLHVAECHTQLIKLGAYQIRPHRLQTKSHQWIWINCMAIIESQTSFQRVRCNYRVISMENVKKFKNAMTFMKKKSIEIQPSFSTAITDSNSSQNHCCTTTVISTSVCRLSSVTSSIAAVENASDLFAATNDCSSKYANGSASTITTEKQPSISSCTAKIVIGPLPPKRICKTGSNKQLGSCRSFYSDNIPSTSLNCSTSLFQRSSNAFLSQSSEILPSRRRSQIPLAFIEHYPLPDSKLTTVEVTSAANSNESCISVSNLTPSSTSVMTPAALSISPMYQQVWEELQRRSEILRQQVLQKEMELCELHLKRFLASLHGDRY